MIRGTWAEGRPFEVRAAAVVTAALAAFVMSGLYYSPLVLGHAWRALDPATAAMSPPPWMMLAEVARTLVVALVIARLLAQLRVGGWRAALRLAIWLWLGFSAMMWVGAIMWQHTPWQLAAIHAGDWLLKLLLIAGILGSWRRRLP